MESGAASEERDDNRLDRAELMRLYEQYAVEIRACLDFAHRYLAFYVGLLSAILVAVVAGLLQADARDFRVFGLLIGPLLMVTLQKSAT